MFTKVIFFPAKLANFSQQIVPVAAYLHIPFCRRRCYYCDFPITVLGERAPTNISPLVVDYVEALCREIEITSASRQSLTTIFFGGGTPSLLPLPLLERILKTIENHFGIAPEAEISMEMDPGTFNREQLQGYVGVGINRVSLGIQAFQDELLQICGRSHSRKDIFAAIELIYRVGVTNFSLDLISGLPNQTIEQWESSLEQAIAIAPHQISCYDLVLEPVTAFGKQYQPGKKPLPTDEDTAEMYGLAHKMLTGAGYEHYEVSNYARSGYQCRHNRVYWENKPYYGFGMGATSYVNGKRFTRPRTRREYYTWIEEGGVIKEPEVSATDFLLESLMLGLRLAEGVSLEQIRQQFGAGVVEQIWICLQPYYRQGWVEILGRDRQTIKFESNNCCITSAERLRLTTPEGFLFSNTILATLFEKLG
ncbi:coproporphyrinogen III oxidase [Pleurocapsales cyanobacterium LEGE 06147]|nr:coproporphyrinogen III oxidase [Pleurocapsales cyanobacterium LEGE 06147]